MALAMLKRFLLLLPAAAVLLALWASIAALVTLPFRHRREEFATSLLATWWDLSKGIMLFCYTNNFGYGLNNAGFIVG